MFRFAPGRWLQARIDRWILARVPRGPGPVTVARQRIYILPTRFGYGFAGMLLVLLLGAMNYGNSMAFLLCFLLAGLALVAMHHTHANLVGIRISAAPIEPVFAGDTAHVPVRLDNPSASARYALATNPYGTTAGGGEQRDLPVGDGALLLPPQTPARRGVHRVGVMQLASEFPLGLFHAWTLFDLDQTLLVYPKPAARGRALPASPGRGGPEAAARGGDDEFSGLRGYQRGDSTHAIHWKSLPKTGALMVKQFADSIAEDRWLDWDQLDPLGVEARLSQLTRWVLDLDAEQHRYGLRLPGTVIEPDSGALHRHHCLRALALFDAA